MIESLLRIGFSNGHTVEVWVTSYSLEDGDLEYTERADAYPKLISVNGPHVIYVLVLEARELDASPTAQLYARLKERTDG